MIREPDAAKRLRFRQAGLSSRVGFFPRRVVLTRAGDCALLMRGGSIARSCGEDIQCTPLALPRAKQIHKGMGMSTFSYAVALLRAGCLLVSVCSLSACVSAPPKQAYNREANSAIKRIDVLPVRNTEVHVDILNHPGYSFGLIGLAIEEANMAPKRNWVQALVKDGQFDHVAIFRERFTKDMAAKGYELIWPEPVVEDPKKEAPRADYGYRKSYGSATDDAQLDLNIGYFGYAAAGTSDSAPYRPTAIVTAKLLSRDGKTVLMADQIIYNPVFPKSEQAITINADPAYAYPEFDALKSVGPKALEGLRGALESTANELAKQY